MDALIYFLLWGALIFLMMRFGCGAHVMGHGHRHKHASESSGDHQIEHVDARWVPPETDIDPVCGKTVQPSSARPSVYDGIVYYFCSRECREKFEAAPTIYLNKNAAPDAPKPEPTDA